jgi:hemin uptake protein HemP
MEFDNAPCSMPGMPFTLKKPAVTSRASVLVIQASELFGEGGIVFIDLGGERYQLRKTRNDKLILTK